MAKCNFPYYSNELRMSFPCGKCFDCKRNRAAGWSFRLFHHEKTAQSAYFLTLTYGDGKIKRSPNGYLTLRKQDWMLYMKRLRKLHKARYGKNGPKLAYYAVGEYGGKGKRPHYHAIIFNANIWDLEKAWSLDGVMIGQIFVGTVTGASVGYVLKYVSKEKTVPAHKNDDRLPEFSLMSKKIGMNYLTENMKRWHKADLTARYYGPHEDGVKVPLPRYYKDKIYTTLQKQIIGKKMQEIEKELENPEKVLQTLQRKEQRLKNPSTHNETF